MMDENDRSHEDRRSLRHISRKEGSDDTAPIEVDSSAFFPRLLRNRRRPRRPSVLLPRSPRTSITMHRYRRRRIRPWMEPWQYLPNGGIFY